MLLVQGAFDARFEDRIFIAAPRARAVVFFEAMEANYLRWHPDHLAFAWTRGRGLGVGNAFAFVERIGGRRMRKAVRIIEVDGDRGFAFEPETPLLRLFLPRMAFAFDPVPGGFDFVATIRLRGIGPLGRRLNRRDFAAVERHMAEEGRNLKAALEGPD